MAPFGGEVRLQVTYYHDSDSPHVDTDNIIKPIQDALNGVIYVDDKQVSDVDCAKRNIDHPVKVRHAPPVLTTAFSGATNFSTSRSSGFPIRRSYVDDPTDQRAASRCSSCE
jgi:crossover junction endodeoxyribonuclease RusA